MALPPFFITTAINYPNGKPHIGHAYEAVLTDIIARYRRLEGRETYFLTGTDEHGLKMQKTAADLGTTPEALLEQTVPVFHELVSTLNISVDQFIRTSEARHHRACQDLWQKMQDAGDIYQGGYKGWYSVRDEAYYAESEVTENAEGVKIGPQGTPVEWTEEASYFFRLSQYQDKLLAHYEANPDFIGPKSRRNEVISFVKGGLLDLSISRKTLKWGIPVPNDPEHVMYVWVDALTNYITALGYPDQKAEGFQTFWPADAHIIGKDIIRFHAVYWPAFLMSAGLPLPKRIYAHGHLLTRGEKMSKSLGNVVDPFGCADTYGVDPFRYFLAREVSFGEDGSYSHDAIVQRINADLANDLGNLAQRSLSMIAKHGGSAVPEAGPLAESDQAMLDLADDVFTRTKSAVDAYQIHLLPSVTWELVAAANRYFASEEPWTLRKSDPERFGTVLYVTAEVLRNIGLLTLPLMPESAGKLLDQLGQSEASRTFAHYGKPGRLSAGTPLPAPSGLFPRFIEPVTDTEGAS